jgi:HEAT repeat protein
MKTLIIVFLAIVIIPLTSVKAGDPPEKQKSAVVDNLTVGIVSDNCGLRTGSANVLSDLITDEYLKSGDASKAMIPLLIMLEKGKTDCERIAAAVALYKLGNPIGIYRLRGIAKFDDNEKVSQVCKNLYYSFHKLSHTEYLVDL